MRLNGVLDAIFKCAFVFNVTSFRRMSGVHVPVRRRPVSARVRVVQRRGDVPGQVGRTGRPVRRARHRRRSQGGGTAGRVRVAVAAAADPGPRRLPARAGRMPVPVQERPVQVDRHPVFRSGRLRRRVGRVGMFRL